MKKIFSVLIIAAACLRAQAAQVTANSLTNLRAPLWITASNSQFGDINFGTNGANAHGIVRGNFLHPGSANNFEIGFISDGDINFSPGQSAIGGRNQIGTTGGVGQWSVMQYQTGSRSAYLMWSADATDNNVSMSAVSNGVSSAILQVFNPSPLWNGSTAFTGGSNVFNFEPNRISMNVPFGGRIMYARYTNSSVGAVSLSFSTNFCSDLIVTTNNLTFSTANASAGGNYESRVFLIRAGVNNVTNISYPAWSTNMNLALPTTMTPGQLLRLELESVGTGETNIIVAGATVHQDLGYAWDTNAQNFFTRAGITSATQKGAVGQLVADAKAHGWWTNCDLIYPFVGGTSNSHAQNLRSTSFNINFHGTVTHDANGITGDAATGYGDTGFTPSTAPSPAYSLGSAHIFLYGGTATPTDTARLASVTGGTRLGIRRSGASMELEGINANTLGTTVSANTDFRGPLAIIRTNTANQIALVRTNFTLDSGTTATAVPTSFVVMLARNDTGTPDSFSSINLRGMTVGGKIAPTVNQASWDIFRQDWDRFEAALGRQVP